MIPRSALILGAGLAGTALARALVLRDWRVTLIDDADPQAGSRQLALAVHPAHAPDASPASELSRIAMAIAEYGGQRH
ncbi:MAG: FAD-dependent oxidoreductase, partial [Burkholderiales bacterium]